MYLNNDDAQKSSVSWLSMSAPMGCPRNKKTKNQQRASMECWLKTLQKLSQWKNNHQELNSVRARDFLHTLGMRRLGAFIVVKGQLRSHECRIFPSMEDTELMLRDPKAFLPILGKHKLGIGPLGVACKLFPCRDLWVVSTQGLVGPMDWLSGSCFHLSVFAYPIRGVSHCSLVWLYFYLSVWVKAFWSIGYMNSRLVGFLMEDWLIGHHMYFDGSMTL